MSSRLDPDLALDYLGELSTDIRAAAILDAGGAPLAGDADLAQPGRDLLAALEPETMQVEVITERGAVFAARSKTHAIVLVAGRFVLPSLMRYDLRMVLGDLASTVP